MVSSDKAGGFLGVSRHTTVLSFWHLAKERVWSLRGEEDLWALGKKGYSPFPRNGKSVGEA